MINEESYKTKFEVLEPWGKEIIEGVKKEIKNEHLRKELSLTQKYFTKKSIDKLTTEDLKDAYFEEVSQGNEEIGEWVTSRWVLKNAEVYHFFARALSDVNPQFDEIQAIPDHLGEPLMRQAVHDFGARTTYIFSILNSVMFSQNLYGQLRQLAQETPAESSLAPEALQESAVSITERYEREMAKLKDRYEKKLLGFQKKYTQDVEGFKKQIKQLQKKLSGNAV